MKTMPKPSKSNILYFDPISSDDFPAIAFPMDMTSENPGSLHFHRGIELGYCHSGAGVFYIDRRIHRFTAGTATVIFPSQPHIGRSVSAQPCQWEFMNADLERLLDGVPAASLMLNRLLAQADTVPNLYRNKHAPEITSLVKMIFREFSEKKAMERKTDYIRALLWALIVKLDELRGTDEPSAAVSKDLYYLIWPAVEYMTGHYGEQIHYEELTRLCFCSEATLRRAFLTVMGCTPMQYLAETRLKAAAGLLRTTGMSVCDISMEVGYQNVSAFNRTFKKRYGKTPVSYRQT